MRRLILVLALTAPLGACTCRAKTDDRAHIDELARPPRQLPAGSVHPSHLTQPPRDAGLDEPIVAAPAAPAEPAAGAPEVRGTAAASAAVRSERVRAVVKTLDADGDGRITRDEAAQAPARRIRALADFDAADVDRDGTLSTAEVEAAIHTDRAPYGGAH